MNEAQLLLARINDRRVNLAQDYGYDDVIPWAEVAREIGVHQSLFSRLKHGKMPSAASLMAITAWLNSECSDCPTSLADKDDEEDTEVEEDPKDSDEDEDEEAEVTQRAVVVTGGALSVSEDLETQAAVVRVTELFAEGAVGVSVALDYLPEDAEVIAEAEAAMAADGWEYPLDYYLPEGFTPRQRIRHIAVVDTPAFADAKLSNSKDAGLIGPIVFEGVYTGDIRFIEAGTLDLEASNLPCPIIWDRQDGDHTGMTVGSVTSWEWQDVTVTSGRAVLDDEAITASLAPLTMPASYFRIDYPSKAVPLTISQPDKQGFRTIYGTAAPSGVCHRSNMVCWTWPGDPDPSHKHFHTGTLLRLDDGKDIRVGALTIGGAHLEAALALSGVKAKTAATHREDANRVFALVRAWETNAGLMIRGVIPPDVTQSDVIRALACSPSIEFWPTGTGSKTLVGIHIVPRPALPVLASVGAAEFYGTDIELAVDPPVEDEPADTPDEDDSEDDLGDQAWKRDVLDALTSLGETLSAILTLMPLDSVDIPEE